MSDYEQFIIYKAIALVVVVCVIRFFYTAFTGKTIEEGQRDREVANQNDQNSTGQ